MPTRTRNKLPAVAAVSFVDDSNQVDRSDDEGAVPAQRPHADVGTGSGAHRIPVDGVDGEGRGGERVGSARQGKGKGGTVRKELLSPGGMKQVRSYLFSLVCRRFEAIYAM